MFHMNPNTVRFYRCSRCRRMKAVTVIKPLPGDDACDCGGRYNTILAETQMRKHKDPC